MSSSLTIRNLNTTRAEALPVPHAFMPQPPFRLIVCGASHSGKSNMIKNMITLDEYGYKAYFGDDIFVFSKTWASTILVSLFGFPRRTCTQNGTTRS